MLAAMRRTSSLVNKFAAERRRFVLEIAERRRREYAPNYLRLRVGKSLASRRFGSDVLRRRPLIGLPPAVERLFIASPVDGGAF
jgi:hypothetical protein